MPQETTHSIDESLVQISKVMTEDELWTAACLRVRTFYEFDPANKKLICLCNREELNRRTGAEDLGSIGFEFFFVFETYV
ncbi:hypothetical protein CDL15_Pgr010648 [Punica granatum]|uniref:Uncharacterized protein n=1 Tax=Punica granatum TaxID=22663 RepID=A0A218VSR9_PUNGR|nr:hypothetical protein CDL15_Pgr010648 [Punica granatum]